MVVHLHRIVGSSVVRYKKGPSPAITAVGVTAMKEVAMKVHSITRGQLHINQWQHLEQGGEGGDEGGGEEGGGEEGGGEELC